MVSIDEELRGAKKIGITGHLRPDGDCVGSTLGLYNYIKDNYSDVEVDIFLEPIEPVFEFLSNTDKIRHNALAGAEYDVFVVLDCGDVERTADFVRNHIKSAHKTICIDHHMTHIPFADVEHVFPQISSASEVLYELLDETRISKAVAECLYVGIIHDTGVLKYQSTTSRTMEIAGKLMDKGIDFTSIVDDTFFRKSYVQNVVTGVALINSKLLLDGKMIYSFLPKSTLDEYGLIGRDTGGIIDELRFTAGVEVAAFLYELPDNKIKGSLRSVKYVDVNKVANEMGGGGHVRAAGFISTDNLDAVVEKLTRLVSEQL